MLNVYNIEKENYVNGNGCRYVIWVQGCDLACKGCWNQETWSFNKRRLMYVEEIFREIKSLESKLDGVTFTGGEPFLQAEKLSILANLIKENTQLNIQIFTGFDKEELTTDEQKKLLKYTDILVGGRFDNTRQNNNQTVYMLNPLSEPWDFNNSDIEIDINDIEINFTGYPSDKLINNIKGKINEGI